LICSECNIIDYLLGSVLRFDCHGYPDELIFFPCIRGYSSS
jgi:hypothetical protein